MFFSFQRKMDGYKFPVYSTEFCPRYQTEWEQRSSAINCNKSNGYMCLSNENITELLEFCYLHPFIWMEEGKKKLLYIFNIKKVHVLFVNCLS